MLPIRIKACSESDLRMLGNLARNIQRVLPVTQADIDAAAALGKGWVVWKVVEVNDPIDNLRGGTQLVIKQNSITPGQNVRRVLIVSGPGGETVVIGPGPSPLLLPDAVANSLSYVKAFGGIKQNGTPTPDAPMDIVCNNGVIKYSANLCDVIPDNIMVGKYISGQGVLVDSDFNFTYIKYIPVKPNTKYTLSLSGAVYFMSMSEYSSAEDAGFVIRKTKYSTSSTPPFDLTYFTLTTGATTNYIRWDANIFRTQAITLNDVLAINWMFNKGDSMPYQPYVEGGVYTDGTKETLQLTGKNLFNWHIGLQLGNDPTVIWTMESGGVTFALNQATGLYTVSGLATGTGGRNTLRTQTFYLPAGTYTISATNNPAINILLVNETTGNTIAQTQSTTTFTLTETTPLHFGLSRMPDTTYDDSFYLQIEQGSTATTYEPYYDGGTATAEMLLKVGNYQDVQSVIDGVVTKNVGVKVLDGTENWISGGDGTGVWANFQSITGVAFATADAFCSHSVYGGANINIVNMNQNEFCLYGNGNISFKNAYTTSTANWTQYLADQYAAGTPVIVIYPLATPTTESVAGQTLQVTSGDNTLEITQASLSGLELEAEYTKTA